MIDLVLSCVIAGVFTIPAGWTVDRVEAPPFYRIESGVCHFQNGVLVCPDPDNRVRVVMRRGVKSGDRVEVPNECAAQIE